MMQTFFLITLNRDEHSIIYIITYKICYATPFILAYAPFWLHIWDFEL
ncbi:hypothetical protein [Plasmodium yoelii yoelii]|uniref:Uncharacterized protein n=1 Tax=Plasmodium yoelii yoelii TaxID=73239 RepID=Q7R8I7_PLAYO|nr:hypothetical protein [Plasmodium yoelii yoelii]